LAKQIEESATVVLNKANLIDPHAARLALEVVEKRFPGKSFLLQNSLQQGGINEWIHSLESTSTSAAAPGFKVDYRRYSRGEQAMAWLDRTFVITAQHPPLACGAAVALIRELL